MIRYVALVAICVAMLAGSVAVNRRLRRALPPRPYPLTLREVFEAEQVIGEMDADWCDPHGIERP